ncbi:hypothetical protein HDU97_001335 [Phlyctochytrium planicorne]|nr:hypothetical protein HDU97_001335 [Phlyctochytrium planicorne]
MHLISALIVAAAAAVTTVNSSPVELAAVAAANSCTFPNTLNGRHKEPATDEMAVLKEKKDLFIYSSDRCSPKKTCLGRSKNAADKKVYDVDCSSTAHDFNWKAVQLGKYAYSICKPLASGSSTYSCIVGDPTQMFINSLDSNAAWNYKVSLSAVDDGYEMHYSNPDGVSGLTHCVKDLPAGIPLIADESKSPKCTKFIFYHA